MQNLAENLLKHAGDRNRYGISVDTFRVSYYGRDFLEFYRHHGMPGVSIEDVFDSENIINRYYAEYAIWEAQAIPSAWIPRLREIANARALVGITDPIIVTDALIRLAQFSRSFQGLLSKVGLGALTDGKFQWRVDFTNTDSVRELLEAILCPDQNDDIFMQFREFMQTDVPAKSAVDYSTLYSYLRFYLQMDSTTNWRILDAGMGDGLGARELAQFDNVQIVGMDFQNYPYNTQEFYAELDEDDPFTPDNNVARAQADARAIPFGAGKFDVVLLVGVAGHLSEDAITRVLAEALRVTAEGGYLLVGPQDFRPRPVYYDEFTSRTNVIRSFQKVGGEFVEVDPLSK